MSETIGVIFTFSITSLLAGIWWFIRNRKGIKEFMTTFGTDNREGTVKFQKRIIDNLDKLASKRLRSISGNLLANGKNSETSGVKFISKLFDDLIEMFNKYQGIVDERHNKPGV